MRRIVWVIIGLPLALIVVGAGTALAWPTTRHMISGLWNYPIDCPPCLPITKCTISQAPRVLLVMLRPCYRTPSGGLKRCTVDALRIL
jgi:hypothetical protein